MQSNGSASPTVLRSTLGFFLPSAGRSPNADADLRGFLPPPAAYVISTLFPRLSAHGLRRGFFSNDTGQFRYSVVSTDRIRWPHLLSCLFTSFFEPAVGHFSTARLAACRPGISALVGSGLDSPRASGSPLAHSTDSQEAPNTRLMLGDRPFLQPTPMWLVCTAYCIFSRWRPMFS